jgi:hypothetical protein
MKQDLIDPTVLHCNPLVFLKIGRQPVVRPRGDRRSQDARPDQRGGEHGGSLLDRIGPRATRATRSSRASIPRRFNRLIRLRTVPPSRPMRTVFAQALAAAGPPDDLGALHALSWTGVGVSQAVDCR